MNKQYIGARYVPKFYNRGDDTGSAEWKANVPYEAMTIVTYLGNSYTSRIPVPAEIGAPNINGKYWVLTGSYNEQVEGYRRDVVGYRAEVVEYKDDVDKLTVEVADNKTATEEAVNRIDGSIASLSETVNRIKDKKIISIGDSYGVQNSDGDITTFYWEYIRRAFGLVEGTSFFHANHSGGGFINGWYFNQLSAIAESMDNKTKTEITDILFEGGWNDSPDEYTYTQFTTVIKTVSDFIKQTFPNANVSVFFSGWGLRNNAQGSNVNQLPRAVDWYSSVGQVGWGYITNSEYALHEYNPAFWQSNGTHPNQLGQERLGMYMVTGLLKGSIDISKRSTLYLTGTSSFSLPASQNIRAEESVVNGVANVSVSNFIVNPTEALVMDGSHAYAVVNTQSNLVRGYANNLGGLASCYGVSATDGAVIDFSAYVYLDSNGNLAFIPIKGSGNTTLTANFTAMGMLPVNLTCPTLMA